MVIPPLFVAVQQLAVSCTAALSGDEGRSVAGALSKAPVFLIPLELSKHSINLLSIFVGLGNSRMFI